jgi:hypothetical protein
MPIVLFKGTVRPVIHKLSINGLPKIRYSWPNENLTVDFAVKVVDSMLEVDCDVSHFDKDRHLSMLAMHAYHLSSVAVDSFCFFSGMGVTAFLEFFVDPDGKETNLAPQSEDIRGLCTAFDLSPSYRGPNNIGAMYSLVAKDRLLLLALNDLIVPISRFDLAIVNCARAMEALRTSMTPDGMDRAQGWPIMHANLNVTKKYLSVITDSSRGPRHGDRRAPDSGQQAEVLKRAWMVMNRFLEYRKRGSVQLPESEFPVLN